MKSLITVLWKRCYEYGVGGKLLEVVRVSNKEVEHHREQIERRVRGCR